MTKRIGPSRQLGIFSAKNLIASGMFLAGLMLGVVSIDIYRNTVIPAAVIIVLIACSTIFGLAILFFLYRTEKLWYLFAVSASFFGGLTIFLTLFVNREFRQDDNIIDQFDIVNRSTMSRSRSGCLRPVIDISFYGQNKELVMLCQDQEFAARAKRIQILYAKGFFGYPYILSKRLLN